jgi:hypothetical protein
VNFVWFIVSLVIFYWLFWKILSLILALPSMGMVVVLGWANEGEPSLFKRLIKWPAFIIARLFGTELQTFTYGIGAGLLAATFAFDSTYPWFYYLVGGLFAITMTAPSGEGNWIGRLEALGLFIVVAIALPSVHPVSDPGTNGLIAPAKSIGSMRLGMSASQAREI